jgi:hypothetical protein
MATAEALRDSDSKVIDVAMDAAFDSHDGFTRAFARQFGITPQKYHAETPAVRYFTHYPISAYYALKEGSTIMEQPKMPRTATVTPVERPARKLILKRAVHATNYFDMCEEIGCDWEGVFNSIPEKLDAWCYCALPPNLVTPGTSNNSSGIEEPIDYAKPTPDGCDVIDLPPCTMLYIQSPPYDDPNDFGFAHDIINEACASCQPELYGWQYAPELAPEITFSAEPKLGARTARPVKKI